MSVNVEVSKPPVHDSAALTVALALSNRLSRRDARVIKSSPMIIPRFIIYDAFRILEFLKA